MFNRRLLHIVLADHKAAAALAFTVGLAIAGGILIMWQARTISVICARVFLQGASLNEMKGALTTFLIILFLRATIGWVQEALADITARRVKSTLRTALCDQLFRLGPLYLRAERTGELNNTLVEGIEALDAYFREFLAQFAIAIVVPLTILIFIFPIDWISGIILLVTAPLIPIFMILIGSIASTLSKHQWQLLSRMSAHYLDVFQGLATLKIFGQSRAQIQVISRIGKEHAAATLRVLRVAFLSSFALELIATLSTAIIAVGIGLRLLNSSLKFEEALFVLFLAPDFYLPLRQLGQRFHASTAGASAAERIFEILDSHSSNGAEDIIYPNPDSQRLSNRPTTPISEIQFHNVSYAYPGETHSVLKEMSFTLKTDTRTALVGASGTGKSTIASLLLRFMHPTEGQINIGNELLEKIPVYEWRSHIAWVPQNPYLFNDTILANIRLAHPDASDGDVYAACRLAHIHDFIMDLPDGYGTITGERGARLSAGQAQRIALARAFLKRDADLVILDEAAANLDPELESQIQESIQRLTEGRCVLIIAHRLATVTSADQILVLEEGKITQTGTHTSLMQEAGLYRKLISPQTSYTSIEPASNTDNLSRPFPSEGENQSGEEKAALSSLISPFILSIFLGMATIASGIGLMSVSAYIISAAALQPSIAELSVAIVGVRFFGIARAVFRYLERITSHRVTLDILTRMRVWFYREVEPLAPARLTEYRSGDLLSRIIADINSLDNFYVRVSYPPLVAVFITVGTAFFLSIFDVRLAYCLLFFIILAGVGMPAIMFWVSRVPGRQLSIQRAELNAVLIDVIQGIPDLLVSNAEQSQLKRLKMISQSYASTQTRMAHITGWQNALEIFFSLMAVWVALVISIPIIREGHLSGIYLAVIIMAVLASFEVVHPLPLAAQYLQTNIAAARRLRQIADSKPEISDPLTPFPLPDKIDLELKNLSFTYPGQKNRVLDNISISIPHGKRVALVGASGAGKSTLVNLLLRFWEYHEGEILLDKIDLRVYAQFDVRRIFSVISQKTDLYNDSVRENLLLARPNALQSEIEDVCRQAQILDFILTLPNGFNTIIGESGLRLSGGERQRLAIARALLKNAPVLILDEASANLDTITERQVLQAIQALMTGRTTLMITHRLVGLENMDEIVVLRNGQVAERGTHQELIHHDGLYARMIAIQNQYINVE